MEKGKRHAARIVVGFRDPAEAGQICGRIRELGHDVITGLDAAASADIILLDAASAALAEGRVADWKRASPWFLPVMVAIRDGAPPDPWLSAGFDDVLRLPCTGTELEARLAIMLRLRRQSRGDGRHGEYLYQALVESSTDHIFVLDREGRYVSSNNRVAHLDMARGLELVGLRLEDVFSSEVAALYRERLESVLESGRTVMFEYELPSRRGAGKSYHLVTLYLIEAEEGGRMAGGICRDISDRKQAELALAASEKRYRSVFEASSAAMVIVNQDATIAFANQECSNAIGFSPAELKGRRWQDFVHPDELPRMEDYFRLRFTNPELAPKRYDTRVLNREGEVVTCLVSIDLLPESRQLMVSMLDISERVSAEELRRVLETAIEHTVEGLFVCDRKNRIIYVNRAMEKMTGFAREEMLAKTPAIFKSGRHEPEFYRGLKETIYQGRPWQGYMSNRKKDGSIYEVFATISPVIDSQGRVSHFVSVHRDVTRERERERRMRQNQRLEAIGTLAGGIAHDFNNILSPIMGYTELCMEALPPGSAVRNDLEQVRLAARRARDLVKQLLSFSRQSEHERVPLDPVPVVKETLKLLRASIPVSIAIRPRINSSGEMVVADPTEIHQVVMNLCINAAHAMPDGGVLSVVLEQVEVGPDLAAGLSRCRPGRYMRLQVGDTGCGIAPEIADKIFEPYFTTRGEGGSGLGLAVTHGIVTSCGGWITVESEPGKGAVFNVYLPLATGGLAAHAAGNEEDVPEGRESILFVDDDPVIAELGRKSLERYGYRVTSHNDPLAALEHFRQDPDAFDLVITDMTMPGLTGDQLAADLLAIRPGLPVVIATGFSERMNADKAAKAGISAFLNKPVAPADLARTVRRILDRGPASL